MSRSSKIIRKTKETEINLNLNLNGTGKAAINTGIGFFDHLLTALAVHGCFDIDISVKGDLIVDGHHTVEDTGIVLGKAFAEALGSKEGIARYGSFFIPMDEALAFCSVDISGRPYLVFDAEFNNEKTGELDNCLIEEFFRSFAFNAGITLHLKALYGKNDHHKAEALFKAAAHALKAACSEDGCGVLSTKGSLD